MAPISYEPQIKNMLLGRRNHKFGEHLRRLRLSRGWSQTLLADKIDRSVSTICTYEQGFNIPPADVLEKLSICFNISMGDLVGSLAPMIHTPRKE